MTINVIGSSLSALIAVLKIVENQNVNWVISDDRIGGHFAGLKVGDELFDVGMVLLEPFEPYSGVKPVFSKNTKPVRHQARDLIPYAFSWLEEKGFEFDEIETKTFYRNRVMSDFYIGDSFEMLSHLSNETKKQIAAEITELNIDATSPLHPLNKLLSKEYRSLSFDEITKSYMGVTYLNEVVSLWANNFFPGVSGYVPAVEHRAAWLPMYYPEFIKDALENAHPARNMPAKRFVAPKLLSVAQLVEDLKQMCLANPRVIPVSYVDFDFKSHRNGSIFLGKESELLDIVDLTKHEQMSTLDKGQKHSSEISVLIFQAITTDADQFTINVCDDPGGVYRVSKRVLDGPFNTRISVEIGRTEGVDGSVLIKTGFESVNKFAEGNFELVKLLRTRIAVGDVGNYKNARDRNSLLEQAMMEAGLPGDIQGNHNSAFNDQLCLGLWHANNAIY